MYKELEPAKAKSKNPEEYWENPLWIAEAKEDGWRFLMHFGGDLDRTYMTGRRVSKRTMRLSEKGLCVPCLWPNAAGLGYTVIDGEVQATTGDWMDVAGIMNVEPDKAAKKIAEIGFPSYTCWDVLFYDGKDVRNECLADRLQFRTEILERISHPLIKPIRSSLSSSRGFYDKIVREGGEGIILKDLASSYGESGSWIKVKKSPTVDVIVTGFTAAKHGVTGKYHGQIGAVKVSVYAADGRTLIEVANVSGMDDATRLDMSQNSWKWLGKVIEVEAQEFSKDRLRSPRFKRLRPDASPQSATFSKMLVDLASVDRTIPMQLSLL